MRPDEQLGRKDIGPSPHQITHSSAVRILTMLRLDSNKDRFLDIGCGRGLIMALALTDFNVPVVGIEQDDLLSGWSFGLLSRSQIHDQDLLTWNWRDYTINLNSLSVTALRELASEPLYQPITAAYSFDKDFPGDTLFHMQLMLKHSDVTRFASSRPPRYWDSSILSWTGEKVRATVCGSGENHTFYFYNVHHCSDTCIVCKKPSRLPLA